MIKSLIQKAVKQYYWYVYNVSPSRADAIYYAQGIYDHALECGYITDAEHKKLCLTLPFETYLK